jgi:hypothetical protein
VKGLELVRFAGRGRLGVRASRLLNQKVGSDGEPTVICR